MQYKAIKHASDNIVKILSGGGVTVEEKRKYGTCKERIC